MSVTHWQVWTDYEACEVFESEADARQWCLEVYGPEADLSMIRECAFTKPSGISTGQYTGYAYWFGNVLRSGVKWTPTGSEEVVIGDNVGATFKANTKADAEMGARQLVDRPELRARELARLRQA